jgi:hypothetical protein
MLFTYSNACWDWGKSCQSTSLVCTSCDNCEIHKCFNAQRTDLPGKEPRLAPVTFKCMLLYGAPWRRGHGGVKSRVYQTVSLLFIQITKSISKTGHSPLQTWHTPNNGDVEIILGPLGTAATPGLLYLPRVIVRMEKLVEWTGLARQNLSRSHFVHQ